MSSLGESGPKARPTGVVEWAKELIFSYRFATVRSETVSDAWACVMRVASASRVRGFRAAGAAVGQHWGDAGR